MSEGVFKIGDRVVIDQTNALIGRIADLPVAGHAFYGVKLDFTQQGLQPFDMTWVAARRLKICTVIDEIGALGRTL